MSFAIVGHQIQPQSNELIHFHEEIRPERFGAIARAKECCALALDLEEQLGLVLGNVYDFEVDLLKLAEGSLIWGKKDHGQAMDERLLLDRRIVNVLTACRMYLDHSAHIVSALFGATAQETLSVVNAKRDAYDKSIHYRIMESLRNYVQHRSLPVDQIKYTTSLVEKKAEEVSEQSVVPILDIDALSEDPKVKAKLIAELKSMGSPVDLRESVRRYVDDIVALHGQIRSIIEPFTAAMVATYEAAVSEYRQRGGMNIIRPIAVELDTEGYRTQECEIFGGLLERLHSLREKNKAVRSLSTCYASNGINR